MKKIHVFILFIGLVVSQNAIAQVSVNLNFGSPPVWAPVDRVETQYYYLPEVDAYYDVPQQRFIYLSNNVWIRSTALPSRYRSYNLNRARIIYLTDYRGNSPYVYHKEHKVKYYTKKRSKTVYIKKHDNGKHKGQGKKHD